MSKIVLFGNEAREKLKKGVDLIANSIKSTLGPRGRNVAFGFHYGFPVVTKDGVTVSRQVDAKDPTEQIGLLLIRQVAQKTADDAGDGTTTASVLAQSIFTEGLKVLGTGANPVLVKRGIDIAAKEVIEFIINNTIKNPSDEELFKIASISANNDIELGKIICEAISKAGKDGVITIEDNYKDMNTYIESIEGMQLNEGFLSPYFVTDPTKMEATYSNPYILIADYEIDHPQPFMEIAEKVLGGQKAPLVIIANNVSGQALATLAKSKYQNGVPVIACKAPYFGDNRSEQLADLAVLTGGRVVSPITGLKFDELTLEDLGRCDKVYATKSFTTFTGGKGKDEDIMARISVLQTSIDKTESDYEKAKLQERLAKLTSGVAVIKVGASTEVELKEKKMRVEDALHATKAALEEGIVPGGGCMLLRASKYLERNTKNDIGSEESIGRKIVIRALQEPIKQIAVNSGVDGSEIIAGIANGDFNAMMGKFESKESINYGYDFLNNKYGNMIEMGVIDPAKVVRLTVENSVSVAGMLLSTEVVIAEEEEADPVARTPKPKGAG